MDNICSGFNKYPIYKVIFKTSENSSENYKYIFTGNQSKDIQKILHNLTKIENPYQNINKENDKKLKNIFGPYKSLFGDILPRKTKFINIDISDFDNIEHIKEDLSYLIVQDILENHQNDTDFYYTYLKNSNSNVKKKYNKSSQKTNLESSIFKDLISSNIYLWAQPEYMNNDYFLNILNYIFGNKNKITTKELMEKLHSITMTKTISDLHDKIIELLPKKYESKSKIGTFKEKIISFENAYLNEDLRYLLTNSLVKLGCSHKIVFDNEDYFYFNYCDPFQAIKDKINIKDSIIYENRSYNLITKDCKIKDHTIFMTTKKILQNNSVSSELEKYYFENKKNSMTLEEEMNHIKKSYSNRNYKKLAFLNDPKILKNDCRIKNFIFRYNEINTRDFKNLNYIFKKFKTNNFIPLITYVKNLKNNDILYKFNKSFVVKKENKELARFYNLLSNPNINFGNECLIFSCDLEENVLIHCYLFNNSYFVISSGFDKYKSISYLNNIVKMVNLLVKSLNKIISFKLIGNVETSVIFRNKYTNIPNQRFINCNLSINYEIKDYKDNLYLSLKKIFSIKSKTYSFISNPIKPELKLVYKGVENFFSPENFTITIIKSLKKYGGKMTKKNKESLNEQLGFLFLTSKEYND